MHFTLGKLKKITYSLDVEKNNVTDAFKNEKGSVMWSAVKSWVTNKNQVEQPLVNSPIPKERSSIQSIQSNRLSSLFDNWPKFNRNPKNLSITVSTLHDDGIPTSPLSAGISTPSSAGSDHYDKIIDVIENYTGPNFNSFTKDKKDNHTKKNQKNNLIIKEKIKIPQINIFNFKNPSPIIPQFEFNLEIEETILTDSIEHEVIFETEETILRDTYDIKELTNTTKHGTFYEKIKNNFSLNNKNYLKGKQLILTPKTTITPSWQSVGKDDKSPETKDRFLKTLENNLNIFDSNFLTELQDKIEKTCLTPKTIPEIFDFVKLNCSGKHKRAQWKEPNSLESIKQTLGLDNQTKTDGFRLILSKKSEYSPSWQEQKNVTFKQFEETQNTLFEIFKERIDPSDKKNLSTLKEIIEETIFLTPENILNIMNKIENSLDKDKLDLQPRRYDRYLQYKKKNEEKYYI